MYGNEKEAFRYFNCLNSFVTQLTSSEEFVNLEQLNISNSVGMVDEESFFSNFHKFTALKTLNISGIKFKDLPALFSAIFKLQTLEELAIDCYFTTVYVTQLIEGNQSRKFPLKINNSTWFSPVLFSQIGVFERFYLSDNILDNSSLDSLSEQFDNTELIVDFCSFSFKPTSILNCFFSKFKNIKRLNVQLGNSVNFEFLKSLFDNNPVEELKIWFTTSFYQFKEIIAVIRNCKLKTLKMEKFGTGTPQVEDVYFKELLGGLTDASLWDELETFGCKYFPIQSVFILLKNRKIKKLREIKLKSIYGDDKRITESTVLPTVRKVKIDFDASTDTFKACNLDELLKMFPQVTELIISDKNPASTLLNVSSLKNLRSLDICCIKLQIPKDFIQLKTLPLLTKLMLIEKFTSSSQFTQGKHLNFPSLAFVGLKTKDQKLKGQFVLDP